MVPSVSGVPTAGSGSTRQKSVGERPVMGPGHSLPATLSPRGTGRPVAPRRARARPPSPSLHPIRADTLVSQALFWWLRQAGRCQTPVFMGCPHMDRWPLKGSEGMTCFVNSFHMRGRQAASG